MRRIFATFLTLFSVCRAGANQCSMYGVCDRSDMDKIKYCNVSQPAQKVTNPEGLEILKSFCPEYAKDGITCCDADQLSILKTSFSRVQTIIGRCPACYRNFLRLFCAMTCDPNQATFVEPKMLTEKGGVSDLDYRISQHFSDTFYDSLKDVSFGGGKAITVICDSTNCNETTLLTNLGDSKKQSPFNINFLVSNSSSTSMNHTVYNCNQTVPSTEGDLSGAPCSCSDCVGSCVIPPVKPSEDPIRILGLDLFWFIFGLVYLLFLIVFISYFVWKMFKKGDQEDQQALFQEIDPDPSAPILDPSEYSGEELDELRKKTGCQTRLSAKLDRTLSKLFGYLAYWIASWPISTLIVASVVILILFSGLIKFQVTTDPIELWSNPDSRARQEKDYFDKNFAPFYRTEQIILQPRNQSLIHIKVPPGSEPVPFGHVWDKAFLNKTLDLQLKVQNLTTFSKTLNRTISLQDICFKPMWPDNDNCAITSPLEYFQANYTRFISEVLDESGFNVEFNYVNRLLLCGQAPYSTNVTLGGDCLASSGFPMPANLVFGGYPGNMFNASNAVVITFLVNNTITKDSLLMKMALEWEAAYLDLVRQWQSENEDVIVAYQAERSVQDELTRQSEADISTVLISYLVMFLYVSICLGSYRSLRTILVDMKLTLGLVGVLIVVLAIISSMGIWSWAKVPASLIIIEVIPFLVLAVGVDNIFILVQDFELDGDGHTTTLPGAFLPRFRHFFGEQSPNQLLNNGGSSPQSVNGGMQYDEIDDDDTDEISTIPVGEDASTFAQPRERAREEIVRRVSRTMARVGPSIFLSSLSEACAFFCGTVSSMPAVKVFSMYAGLAIIMNFLMQITVFIALLTLDARRTVARRFDVLCCFSLSSRKQVLDIWPERSPQQASNGESSHNEPRQLVGESSCKSTTDHEWKKNNRPWLYRMVANVWAPFLLSDKVRPVVVAIMVGWACFCLAIIPDGLQIGLDQKLSMPLDSYMLHYFEALSSLLKIGPPVYFVVTGNHNYTDPRGQNQVCGIPGCDDNSLVTKLTYGSLIPQTSRLASEPMSWIDDYFDWLSANADTYDCCRVKKLNQSEFCPSDWKKADCLPCNVTWVFPTANSSRRPSQEDFSRYLPFFLDQNPGTTCPKGGRAAYHVGVKLKNHSVQTSYFMTYHTTLRESPDFIDAVREARNFADEINKAWTNKTVYNGVPSKIENNTVFPYSVFYVFYEQYLNQKAEAALQLGICSVAILAITIIVLGLDLLATFIVILGVAQILLSVVAVMVLWNITLNALSLVNLVVCVGIAVEFCVHVIRAYTVSLAKTRLERAKNALATMGSSVLRGITLTKLGGILVLGFSKSRLFQVFYFRMYLSMVIFGAIVGLIFVPVILSYIGPSVNAALVLEAQKQKDEEKSAKKRRAYLPRSDTSTSIPDLL